MIALRLAAVVLMVACGVAHAAAPRATPTYVPAPAMVSGKLGAVGHSVLTLRTVEYGDLAIDVSSVRDVWRERSVAVDALEIGHDLTVSGSPEATAFVARYIYANIGRLDGIIRRIDGGSLVLGLLPHDGTAGSDVRVQVSQYLRGDSLTIADVTVGEVIGAVVYYERGTAGEITTRRITKMWR